MTRPGIKVDIAFDSTYSTAAASRTWTDVTEYVKSAENINIKHGRQDEHSRADANTCTLTLNNSDGRFTPGLASSPYYPNVKIGRPLRVCVNLCTHGDNGTFEADATGWVGVNASVARTTSQAQSGAAGLSITSTTASGNASAVTPSGTSGIPIVAGVTYRFSSWFKRGPTARQCDLLAVWYDSVGTQISSSASAQITDSATWQQIVFSAAAPTGAVYVRIQARILAPSNGEVHYIDDVRLDVDRFVGYVDEWPLEWPGVVSTFATSTITASSRMARLGLSDKLQPEVVLTTLEDQPVAYYTLGESVGATRANDSSGNSAQPAIVPTVAKPTFGVDLGLTAPSLGTGVTIPANVNTHLRAGGFNATLHGFGFLLSLSGTLPSTGVQIARATNTSTGVAAARVQVFSGPDELDIALPGSVSVTASIATGATHHYFVAQDGANVKLYVDGVLTDTAAATMGSFTDLFIGYSEDSLGALGATFAHFALYTAAVSADRIAEIAEASLTGLSGDSAADRLAAYAGYADVPAAEYSFDALANTRMARIDTAGQGVVELMQNVAGTDGGVLYDGPDGVLTYKARSRRYNSAASPTLDVSAGEVEVGYVPKYDRSALTNRMTATLSDGTYSTTAESTASVTAYGVHDPGDLTLYTTDSNQAHAAAWWRVNTYNEPSTRAPQLTVELAKMTPTRQARILSIQVGDRIAVSNLPSQSDASTKEFFVEGWTETITDSQLRIEFNVSPAAGFEVWEVEHATYGQYDAYPLAW